MVYREKAVQMKIITSHFSHEFLYDGVRVLLLVSRKKDGAEKGKELSRVSTSIDQFLSTFDELKQMAGPYDRIYVSAVKRSLEKAIKHFEKQLLNHHHDDRAIAFYKNIQNRWISALMQYQSTEKADRVWLVDCDGPQQINEFSAELLDKKVNRLYTYPTKNGLHMLIKPVNREILSAQLREQTQLNPMVLWGYGE